MIYYSQQFIKMELLMYPRGKVKYGQGFRDAKQRKICTG